MNSNKVMLFMKGNPDQPKCGFSQKTVALMKQEGVAFGTFDILQDEAIRQGKWRALNTSMRFSTDNRPSSPLQV